MADRAALSVCFRAPIPLSFDLSGGRYGRVNPVVLRPTEPFLRGKPLSCAFYALCGNSEWNLTAECEESRKSRSGFFNSFFKDYYATAESPHPPPGIRGESPPLKKSIVRGLNKPFPFQRWAFTIPARPDPAVRPAAPTVPDAPSRRGVVPIPAPV